MEQSLPFATTLLDCADYLCEHRLYDQAVPLLERLLELEHVPNWVRREVLAMLAEAELDRGRYYKARRHLTAALAYGPHDAHMLFLIGLSYEWQEEPLPYRAYQYYRQAAYLEPDNALYRAAYQCLRVEIYGSAAVQREALDQLFKAYCRAPDSPEVCYYYARGLLAAKKRDAALWVARRAARDWPDLEEFHELIRSILCPQRPAKPARKEAVQVDRAYVIKFPCGERERRSRRQGVLEPYGLAKLLGFWPAARRRWLAEQLGLGPEHQPARIAQRLQSAEGIAGLIDQLTPLAREYLRQLCATATFASPGFCLDPAIWRRCPAAVLRELLHRGLIFALRHDGRPTFRRGPNVVLTIPTSMWPFLNRWLNEQETNGQPSAPALRAM